MTCALRWLGAWLIIALCWAAPLPASAHGFRPGVLTLEEVDSGVFTIRWTAPVDTSHPGPPVEVVFPASCRQRESRLECGASGLDEEVVFTGLQHQDAPIVVRASFVDGRTTEAMVWPGAPTWSVEHTAARSVSAWVYAGVRHIFGGLDHLAFLLGLLLVVGFANFRRLLATVTAFTLAHSAALMFAALGWVHVRAAPVEATIAASVILVAREGMRRSTLGSDEESTFTQRWPWAVALLFGLVHGLGFASALDGETGGAALGTTVVLFNVGVELGQIAIIGLSYALLRLLPPSVRRLRIPVCYALGGVAAFWLIERTWVLLTAGS